MGDFLTVLLGTSMAVSISFLLLLSIHTIGYSMVILPGIID